MRVLWHRETSRDAEEAAVYYEDRSEGLGDEFLDELEDSIDRIAQAPKRWPLWLLVADELKIRKYAMRRFPYAVAYVSDADIVRVLAVAHAKRRPGFWISRK